MKNIYKQPRQNIEKTRKNPFKETAELAEQIETVYMDILNSDLTKPSMPELSKDMESIIRINHMLNGLNYLDRTSLDYTRAQTMVDVAFDALSKEYKERIMRR